MKFIDVHCYYGYWPWPIRRMEIKDIIKLMKKLGIEKAMVVSSLAINYDFIEGNKELSRVIEGWKNIFGYVYVNAHYKKESLKEIEKYLPKKEFIGVKFHPEYSRCKVDDKENDIFFELLENKYKKVLLVHSWGLPEHDNPVPYSLPQYVINLAKRRPHLKIIMGHMGGPEWKEAIEVSKGVDNVWLDIATSYAHYDKIEYAVKKLGSCRILFGTGMTENNPSVQIGAVLEANISEEDRERICWKNAQEIFPEI